MHIIRITANILSGALFVFSVLFLTLSILKQRLPGVEDAILETRCAIGVPAEGTDCAASRIASLEAELEAALSEANDSASGQNLVFEQGQDVTDTVSVVVGTIYREVSGIKVAVRSFCFANLDSAGLDPRRVLAIKEADGTISSGTITMDDLALLGVEPADIEAARGACQFPDMS